LHAHAGDLEGARKLARQNIAAFEVEQAFLPVPAAKETTPSSSQEAPIITNAGGCGAMLASYAHLLADDAAFAARARNFSARVRDVGQQLETTETTTAVSVNRQPVTYDASCHLLYGQHAADESLKIMGAVVNQDFVKLEGAERCCGGAGIYNLLEADLSGQVLNEKLIEIRRTGAKVLASGNPGCQMQIGAGALLAGMDLIVCHPVELLDEAYASAGKYSAADFRE
jgi:glycolate oxidase iron-sulfur subunit